MDNPRVRIDDQHWGVDDTFGLVGDLRGRVGGALSWVGERSVKYGNSSPFFFFHFSFFFFACTDVRECTSSMKIYLLLARERDRILCMDYSTWHKTLFFNRISHLLPPQARVEKAYMASIRRSHQAKDSGSKAKRMRLPRLKRSVVETHPPPLVEFYTLTCLQIYVTTYKHH